MRLTLNKRIWGIRVCDKHIDHQQYVFVHTITLYQICPAASIEWSKYQSKLAQRTLLAALFTISRI